MLNLDKLRLSAYVKLGKSPLPRPKLVHESRTRILDRFYLDVSRGWSSEKRLALWNRLNTENEKATIRMDELAVAIALVFCGFDKKHPPLSERLPLVEKLITQVIASKDPRCGLILVHQYFAMYPLEVAYEPELRELLKNASKLHERTGKSLTWMFFADQATEKTCNAIPPNLNFKEGFALITQDVIHPGSHFAMRVYERFVLRYSSMIRAAVGKPGQLEPVLEKIKEDLQTQRGSAQWMELVPKVAEAICKPIDIGTGVLPKREEQVLLSQFFNLLFCVVDKGQQSPWPDAYAKWQALLKHWEFGLNLNALFDCATEFIEGNHRSSSSEKEVAIRHWVARRKFWVAYWAAGRLHNVRLLFPSNSSAMRRKDLQRKYALRPTPGIKVGMPASAVGFLAQIDELYISEQSSNGSFRVYLNKPSWFHDSEVQTSEVNADSDSEFRHYTGWQGEVNWYIATQTGKPTPTNAR